MNAHQQSVPRADLQRQQILTQGRRTAFREGQGVFDVFRDHHITSDFEHSQLKIASGDLQKHFGYELSLIKVETRDLPGSL